MIDLHIHSTASDGAYPPSEVVERAIQGGLHTIALADHDTVAGVADAIATAGSRIQVIPAIEISAGHRGRDLHILGYFVDITFPRLVEFSRRALLVREERVRGMIERLEGLGVDVDFGQVLEAAGPDAGALARPHLARALLAGGHVGSINEAFERFIGDEGPAFVPVDNLDVAGAIELIHQAGGIAVWAHPPMPLLGSALRQFVDAGLDGIECFRPRVQDVDLNRLLNKARDHRLIVTGGSDWHGDWHGPLGSFSLQRDQVSDFLQRGGL